MSTDQLSFTKKVKRANKETVFFFYPSLIPVYYRKIYADFFSHRLIYLSPSIYILLRENQKFKNKSCIEIMVWVDFTKKRFNFTGFPCPTCYEDDKKIKFYGS
jgi:hypothetical protein